MRFTIGLGLLACFGLGLSGCSSSSSPAEEAGPCVRRVGTYHFEYVERSGGTCGAIASHTETSSAQPTAPPASCKGTLTASSDNCTVTIATSCPVSGTTNTVEQAGDFHWNKDGTRGTSAMHVTLLDAAGATKCDSTYDITATKV